MRSPNTFLFSNRFFATARWVDQDGPFVLWPTIWVEWNIEPVLGVWVKRWTIGVGQARFQLDWGRWERPDPKAPLDWKLSGLDGFLGWSRKLFGRNWGRTDIERLFKDRPEWRHLVGMGGARAHYVRLLLARELFETPEQRLGPGGKGAQGLSALEAAFELDAPMGDGEDAPARTGKLSASASRTMGVDALDDQGKPHQKAGPPR
jgi:hypothetical protein